MSPKYDYKISDESNGSVYIANLHKSEPFFFGMVFRKRRKYWIFGPIIEEEVFNLFEIGEAKEAKKKLDDKLDKIIAGLNSKWYPIFYSENFYKDSNQPELYNGNIRTYYYKYSWILNKVIDVGIEYESFAKKTKQDILSLKKAMINRIVQSNPSKFYSDDYNR